jgi:hypothetical protein
VPGKIHRQESDVCANVTISKAIVELDAVDDGDPFVRPEIDVLEPEISMPVADSP